MKHILKNKFPLNSHQTVIIALLGFIVWLLLVTGLHLLPAHAGPGPRGMDPEKQLAHLKDRLQLDDEQVEQIRPIITDAAAKRHAIMERYRSQGRSGMAAARKEMETLREETESRLGEILSAEQMTVFRELREEQRQRMRKRRQP